MSIEIRQLEVEELGAFLIACWRGFHLNTFPDGLLELRRERFVAGRYWAAFDDGDIVATLHSLPLATTMPGGGTVRTAGVTNVTVAGTHRRQGLMSKLMAAELQTARGRGERVASLIAAEWPIYGRFGFGPATESADYVLDARAEFTNGGEGTVEFVTPAELLDAAPAIYDRHRATSVGEVDRTSVWWKTIAHVVQLEPWKGLQVLCRDRDGTPTGYAMYTIDEKWERRRPDATLKLDEMIATDPQSEARLWRFLCEIDFVARIEVESRRVHEPLEHWVTDARALALTGRADTVWARPLDLATALTTRRYAVPGTIVVAVDDPMGLCGGTVRLTVDDDGTAACDATTEAPDVTVSMSVLGACLYGSNSLLRLHARGDIDEHRPGAVRRLDLLLRWPDDPWTATWF